MRKILMFVLFCGFLASYTHIKTITTGRGKHQKTVVIKRKGL